MKFYIETLVKKERPKQNGYVFCIKKTSRTNIDRLYFHKQDQDWWKKHIYLWLKEVSLQEIMVECLSWIDQGFFKVGQDSYILKYTSLKDKRFGNEELVNEFLKLKGYIIL